MNINIEMETFLSSINDEDKKELFHNIVEELNYINLITSPDIDEIEELFNIIWEEDEDRVKDLILDKGVDTLINYMEDWQTIDSSKLKSYILIKDRSIVNRMKYEFLKNNIDNINLEDLERLVK